MVAGRYAVAAPVRAEINTFSANPELSVALRYAVAAPVGSETKIFSANPELMVAQCYTKAAEGTILSNNPELILTQRHFKTRTSLIDREFMASNPEIKVHLHYLEEIGR